MTSLEAEMLVAKPTSVSEELLKHTELGLTLKQRKKVIGFIHRHNISLTKFFVNLAVVQTIYQTADMCCCIWEKEMSLGILRLLMWKMERPCYTRYCNIKEIL